MSSSSHPKSANQASSEQQAWFTTTHWSMVITAKEGSDTMASEALEKLCQTYWPPLYTFIRRDGYSQEDAQDLTQEFFRKLLANDYLHHLRHQRGRFRSFLLTLVKHFLSDQRDKANAQKRGGGKIPISLDDTQMEEAGWLEPKSVEDPVKLYEQRWAHAVLEETTARLTDEYHAEGKGELFRRMKEYQPGKHGERSYAEVAIELDMTETAFKSAIHRMRKRYSHKLREVVADTVATPAEIDEEIRHLKTVLSG